jgi:secretion/DNA translocation related CpaE-like protein
MRRCPQVFRAPFILLRRRSRLGVMEPAHATTATLATHPTVASHPVVATADPDLLAQLMRLCAAASVTPDVIEQPEHLRAAWRAAPLVVVGADLADDIAPLQLERRAGVVLAADGVESTALWRRGVALGAEQVITLPQAQGWLVERLTEAAEDPGPSGTAVAVIGARGGAGASTLAAGLALRAAARGERVLLIDADPLGGGIELLLGSEGRPGLRWPEVAATQGRVSASALRKALPRHDDVAVLSWDRGAMSASAAISAGAMRSVLAAARRGSDLVVVDLPRRLDDAATEALVNAAMLLLVCTTDVRSVASAGQMLASLRLLCGDVRVVVREFRTSDVGAERVAASLHLPLAGVLPTMRGVERGINEGIGPLVRGRLGARCDRLLRALDHNREGSGDSR